MWWVVRQLFAPLRYLMISQGDGFFQSKRAYDLVLPGAFSAMATFLVYRFDLKLGTFANKGLVPDVLGLLNLMIAFFIAALAAVATFDRAGLDDRLKGDPAILTRKNHRNMPIPHILTHRQFVCYLFGYLSFASIMLLLSMYAVRIFGLQVQSLLAAHSAIVLPLKEAAAFGFFFMLAQLLVTMLLGIYFLCDRLQFMDDGTV